MSKPAIPKATKKTKNVSLFPTKHLTLQQEERNMAHQIVIEVADGSILPSLRKILTHIKGVSVRSQKEIQEEAPLSAYEESLNDLREGRTNTYPSAEDFFDKMGI